MFVYGCTNLLEIPTFASMLRKVKRNIQKLNTNIDPTSVVHAIITLNSFEKHVFFIA